MSFESHAPGSEPEILEVKLDPLQRAGVRLLVLAVIFTVIGYFVSPHDKAGKPILLLPEVKQMETYRRSSFQWIDDFRTLDSQIVTITANQQGDLFTRSREAQSSLQLAVQLAQEIDQATFPPSAVSLHGELASTSLSYLETARKMMIWIGAPEDSKLTAMNESLSQARQLFSTLEKSKWLETQ